MLNASPEYTHSDAASPHYPSSFRLGNLRARLLVGILCIAAAGFVAFACSGPTANLVVTAPTTASAGSPLTVTVSAMVNGKPDTIFNAVVHFTSSDHAAVLPVDYVFAASDAGSHTFINGVTLMTAGSQSITATDTDSSFLTATANVTVSSATLPSN